MLSYTLRRGRSTLISLFVLLTAVFFLSRLSGDPTNLYIPVEGSDELRQRFRESHGFDEPILSQFAEYLSDLTRLDFGESMLQETPALDIVMNRLPATLLLAGATLAAAMVLGVTLGVIAAFRQGSVVDRVANAVSLAGTALPDFWIGLVLILVFAQTLDLFPTSGSGSLKHLVLPVLTLLARPLGSITQLTRTAVLQQLSESYIVTAQAKGASLLRTVRHHALRNAMASVVTVAGDQFLLLAGGAIVVENVFAWPGIGQLMLDAINNRDFAIIQAAVFVVAMVVFVVNFLIDLIYAVIDPRIRFR